MRWAGIFAAAVLGMGAAGAEVSESGLPGDSARLERLREDFDRAPESAEATRRLKRRIAAEMPPDRGEWPTIYLAYDAALEGLEGKHSAAPWDKYVRAKSGLAKLDALVSAQPDSIEIRALRYFYCRGLPDMFGAGGRVAEDYAALAELYARGADETVAGSYRESLRARLLEEAPAEGEAKNKLKTAPAETIAGPGK